MSNIEWTGETWNPIVGCSKISEGCRNCYAINQAYRNSAMGAKLEKPGRLAYYEGLTEKRGDRVEWTSIVRFVPEALEIPLKRKKPTTWFVNSMSDLFHESVTDERLDQIFAVIALTPRHTYQILTKRPRRMMEYLTAKTEGDFFAENSKLGFEDRMLLKGFGGIFPLPNVWLGVTVENQKAADDRIPLLLKTPAAIRFLSCEPLLEAVSLEAAFSTYDANGEPSSPRCNPDGSNAISWVIAGGESGHKARACNVEWIRSLVYQCKEAGVPVFVKQLGSNSNHSCAGKGATIAEFPKDLQIREMPYR